MKNRICLLFMLTAVMYGCQKSETAFPQSTDSTYKAYVEQYDVDVKTAMTSDRKIVWTIDDRIAVFMEPHLCMSLFWTMRMPVLQKDCLAPRQAIRMHLVIRV